MSELQQEPALKGFFKKHLGWVVTGFLTLLFWMQTCNLQEKIEEGKVQITKLELDKQTLTKKVNQQGRTIYSQRVILARNTQSLNLLTDSIFNLKEKDRKNTETIAYFKNITQFSITSVNVPYLDTVKMRRFSDSVLASCPTIVSYMRDSTIQVPQTSYLNTPHFEIGATVKKQGLTIDKLNIPDTLQLRFVEHKGKLFKKGSVEVQYFHSNPYVQNLSANSAFYKPKRQSFFKRIILPVAVGIGVGILIK